MSFCVKCFSFCNVMEVNGSAPYIEVSKPGVCPCITGEGCTTTPRLPAGSTVKIRGYKHAPCLVVWFPTRHWPTLYYYITVGVCDLIVCGAVVYFLFTH